MKCILTVLIMYSFSMSIVANAKTIEIKYLVNKQINSQSRIEFERDFFHSLPRYAKPGQEVYLSHVKSTMTNLRAYAEMDAERRINILMLPAKKDLEFKALVVPIPVMKGLLGFRKIIARDAIHQSLAEVENIDQLRKFKVGQVEEWIEASIYRGNNFNLVPAPKIKNLFHMLKEGRFDLLPLGIIEVEQEFSAWQARIDYSIDPNIMLYYDLPVVLYVSPDRPDLAAFLTDAVNAMVHDGTLDMLLNKHYGEYVNQIKNHQGQVIYLENKSLPENIPYEKPEYWLEKVRHVH